MNSKVWILVLIAIICLIAYAEGASKAAAKTKAAGSKAAGSKAAGSKAAGTKAAGTKAAGSKAAGTKAAGSKAAGSKAAGSKAAGSKAATTGGKPVGISPLPSRSNQPKTICNTYSKALNLTNEALMYAVVNGVEFQVTMNPELLQYFNGTKPPGSRDFTDPANRDLMAGLTKRLVAFFGGLTGCTMDPHFPKFKKTANFRRLHQRMGISNSDFDMFNSIVLSVMQGAGVTQADLTTMKSLLETLRPKIVKGKRSVAPPPAASKPAGTKPAATKAAGSKAAGSKAAAKTKAAGSKAKASKAKAT